MVVVFSLSVVFIYNDNGDDFFGRVLFSCSVVAPLGVCSLLLRSFAFFTRLTFLLLLWVFCSLLLRSFALFTRSTSCFSCPSRTYIQQLFTFLVNSLFLFSLCVLLPFHFFALGRFSLIFVLFASILFFCFFIHRRIVLFLIFDSSCVGSLTLFFSC